MKGIKILAVILTAIFLVGLTAGAARAKTAADPTLTWARATALKLNKAVFTGDYAGYKAPWDPNSAKAITKEKFEQISNKLKVLGATKSMTFYNKTKIQGYTVYQWKATFTKHNKPLYVRLVFKEKGKVDGHYILSSPALPK